MAGDWGEWERCSAHTELGRDGVTALPACCLSVRPLSCPTGTPWQSALVSLQGAALKYLPSILEDVFGIFDSSMLG